MPNLKIYCSTIKYYKILEKLPSYITPVGLGENYFPYNWDVEKKGMNISNLNKYYAQLTMYYWIWKNKLKNSSAEDYVGNCEHRLFWLNNLYSKKEKFSSVSLYSKLLSPKNDIFNSQEIIAPQPIIFKNKSLFKDFEEIHEKNILQDVISFLPKEEHYHFKRHLEKNTLHIGPMFITKKKYFEEYCELIFPWVDQCLKYCLSKKLCHGYNVRLPVFLAERFTSYWISKFKKKTTLSYSRLGNVHLFNKLNTFVNTMKFPFTFHQYPTIYQY